MVLRALNRLIWSSVAIPQILSSVGYAVISQTKVASAHEDGEGSAAVSAGDGAVDSAASVSAKVVQGSAQPAPLAERN